MVRSAADRYVRLPRARVHTERSLAGVRRATSAHKRRNGIGPDPMPDELKMALPCWSSPRNMRKLVDHLAKQPRTKELCKASGGLAVDIWWAIMVNDIADADHRTGRGMHVSQDVAAERVQRGDRQVARARWVSVQLGIMVEYFRGYQLSGDQRRELVAEDPGNEQRGIPNGYALGVCPPRQRQRISTPIPGQYAQVKANVALPIHGHLWLESHLTGPLSNAGAGASATAAAPSAPQPRRKPRPGMGLAYELLAHPGLKLLTGVKAYTIDRQLEPYRAGGWHGLALADMVIQIGNRLNWDLPDSPHEALRTILSHIDPVADVVLADRTPPVPCGRPDCDMGWIQTSATAVTKCPHCPPAIRTGRIPRPTTPLLDRYRAAINARDPLNEEPPW